MFTFNLEVPFNARPIMRVVEDVVRQASRSVLGVTDPGAKEYCPIGYTGPLHKLEVLEEPVPADVHGEGDFQALVKATFLQAKAEFRIRGFHPNSNGVTVTYHAVADGTIAFASYWGHHPSCGVVVKLVGAGHDARPSKMSEVLQGKAFTDVHEKLC